LPDAERPRRFLPADPRAETPYRLTPQVALRVAALGIVAVGVFAVLLLRLWALQVLSGSHYVLQASDNTVRTIQIPAPRGTIIDANGNILVQNAAAWNLELWPADLPTRWPAEQRELRVVSAAADIPVAQMLSELRASADDPSTPIVVARSIRLAEVEYFDERQLELPGVQLVSTYVRNYPYGSLAAQLLGYVGPITAAELPAAEKEGYQPQDVMGQAGVEATYDRYLRGTDGSAQVTVNALGEAASAPQETTLPQPGDTLRLTIRTKLQQAAERALASGIALARTSAEGAYADGGAIVALDPHTGAVLAMASNPTYDPSAFVTRDPTKLAPLLDPTVAAADNSPGLNRAIDVGYPPGSTFKPVTALAAMEEGILTPTENLDCTASFTFYQETFYNWDLYVDQWMALPTALAQSCDTFFYQVGAKFYKMPASDGATLQKWASKFGFGKDTGIDVGPEDPGLVPTPTWRCDAYGGPPCDTLERTWKPGYEVQLAIGQGDLLVTPIQMARLYAMIANGGDLVTPHVAEDVETPGSSDSPPQVLRDLATQQPTSTGVSPVALKAVQQGLYQGTHSPLGTSYGVFGQFPVPIAGKTGTAQKLINVRGFPAPLELNQSWWCGYGPVDDPQIVVCAVIENGGEGGSAAAPAALQVFESYFGKQGIVTPHISD
jgi:penicillin-binding protein 2